MRMSLPWAAAQVKNALDATKALGGENYVFWGGREGYESLLNTDLKHEQEAAGALFPHGGGLCQTDRLQGAVFSSNPSPASRPSISTISTPPRRWRFLRQYDLIDYFKINVEANHATLAKHTFEHELTVASAAGKLGSVDANRGDLLLGWDTDQFPTDLYSTTLAMMIILKQNGLGSGGLNFDAHVRRSSIDPVDLFHAHIGGMDAFAAVC
jgi:xylose isomerase